MPVALSRAKVVEPANPVPTPLWAHLVLLAAAGLFVSVLIMTYGVDLRPGLF